MMPLYLSPHPTPPHPLPPSTQEEDTAPPSWVAAVYLPLGFIHCDGLACLGLTGGDAWKEEGGLGCVGGGYGG